MSLELDGLRPVYLKGGKPIVLLQEVPEARRVTRDMGLSMTDLEVIKKAIGDRIRDQELASSACYEVDAYARRWPFIFLINDWDVWNESRKALRLQVVRWLEANCTPYDFHQFRTGWGLIGFESQEAASRFELRWSGQIDSFSMPDEDLNPHPLKSTFEPTYMGKANGQGHFGQRSMR